MWKKELQTIIRDKKLRIVLIVIACIPLLYAAVFLGSIWDPYAKLDQLKVAVVNEDQQATFQSKEIAIGDTLVKNLQKNDALDFEIVSSQQAKKGLEDGTYYMKITIPKTFSKQATTLFEETPQPMQLAYETNPGRNMVVGTIAESATKSLQESVRKEVTKTYTKALFEQFKTVGSGLVTAGEGAMQVETGTNELAKGAQTLTDNLTKLQASTLAFADGSHTYEQGISTYTTGVSTLNDGAQQVNQGTQALATRIPSLTSGVGQLSQGTQALNEGVTAYTSGVANVNTGVATLAQTNPQLVTAVQGLQDGLATLSEQASTLPTALTSINEGTTTLDNTVQTQLLPLVNNLVEQLQQKTTSVDTQEISQTTEQLNQSMTAIIMQLDTDQATQLAEQLTQLTTLSEAQQQSVISETTAFLTQLTPLKEQMKAISQSIEAIQSQLSQLSTVSTSPALATATTLQQGMVQFGDSFTTLSTNLTQVTQSTPAVTEALTTLTAGSQKLTDGIVTYTDRVDQLSAGTAQLVTSTPTLLSGSTQLTQGVTQLATQMPTLAEGVSSLASGTEKVADGSQKLVNNSPALTQGVAKLATASTQLAAGSQQLAQGSQTLATGGRTLDDGVTTLAENLTSNGQDVTTQATVSDHTIDMFATPVALTKTEYSQVKNYGSGLAPYFLSVALFVGALAFNVIYPMAKAIKKPSKTWEIFTSKWILMILFALSQAVILATVMLFGMKIQHQSIAGFYIMAIFSSLASTSLVTLLNVAFGTVGKGLSMVMLVLQLGSAGGTFPLDVSNSFYQFLHPLFPITYSVMGLRQVISGGMQAHAFIQAVLILGTYLFVFSGFLYVTFWRKFKTNRIETVN